MVVQEEKEKKKRQVLCQSNHPPLTTIACHAAVQDSVPDAAEAAVVAAVAVGAVAGASEAEACVAERQE